MPRKKAINVFASSPLAHKTGVKLPAGSQSEPDDAPLERRNLFAEYAYNAPGSVKDLGCMFHVFSYHVYLLTTYLKCLKRRPHLPMFLTALLPHYRSNMKSFLVRNVARSARTLATTLVWLEHRSTRDLMSGLGWCARMVRKSAVRG